MEGFNPSKKTPEKNRLDQEEGFETIPGDLTPEQEADLRKELLTIDSPNVQKKSQ